MYEIAFWCSVGINCLLFLLVGALAGNLSARMGLQEELEGLIDEIDGEESRKQAADQFAEEVKSAEDIKDTS